MDVLSHPAVLAVKDCDIDGEDPDAGRPNAEGGVMYICRRLRVPGNSTLEVYTGEGSLLVHRQHEGG